MKSPIRFPFLLLALVAPVLVTGCASAPVAIDVPDRLPQQVAQYLLVPDTQGLSDDVAGRLRGAHLDLIERSDLAGAAATARGLLGPGDEAAKVLLAQVAFAREDYQSVLSALEDLVAGGGGSDPALLLTGRSAELSGRPLLAYAAYRGLPGNTLADRGRSGLETEALDLASNEVASALESERIDLAEQWLATLREWAPESPRTLRSELAVARASGDVLGELGALRDLRARTDMDTESLIQMAWLELDVGDPQAGVDLFGLLGERFPDDEAIRDGLAAAKFRWRLDMLPEEASSLVRSRALTRAEFASLMYWIVPGVRTDRGTAGEIVSDVLDHPMREAIVRVVNLGIMEVADSARHRFSPDREINRARAFESLLGLPTVLGSRPACLATFAKNPSPSEDAVCEAARSCGIMPPEDSCLAGSVITGSQASEALRRTLDLLE